MILAGDASVASYDGRLNLDTSRFDVLNAPAGVQGRASSMSHVELVQSAFDPVVGVFYDKGMTSEELGRVVRSLVERDSLKGIDETWFPSGTPTKVPNLAPRLNDIKTGFQQLSDTTARGAGDVLEGHVHALKSLFSTLEGRAPEGPMDWKCFVFSSDHAAAFDRRTVERARELAFVASLLFWLRQGWTPLKVVWRSDGIEAGYEGAPNRVQVWGHKAVLQAPEGQEKVMQLYHTAFDDLTPVEEDAVATMKEASRGADVSKNSNVAPLQEQRSEFGCLELCGTRVHGTSLQEEFSKTLQDTNLTQEKIGDLVKAIVRHALPERKRNGLGLSWHEPEGSTPRERLTRLFRRERLLDAHFDIEVGDGVLLRTIKLNEGIVPTEKALVHGDEWGSNYLYDASDGRVIAIDFEDAVVWTLGTSDPKTGGGSLWWRSCTLDSNEAGARLEDVCLDRLSVTSSLGRLLTALVQVEVSKTFDERIGDDILQRLSIYLVEAIGAFIQRLDTVGAIGPSDAFLSEEQRVHQCRLLLLAMYDWTSYWMTKPKKDGSGRSKFEVRAASLWKHLIEGLLVATHADSGFFVRCLQDARKRMELAASIASSCALSTTSWGFGTQRDHVLREFFETASEDDHTFLDFTATDVCSGDGVVNGALLNANEDDGRSGANDWINIVFENQKLLDAYKFHIATFREYFSVDFSKDPTVCLGSKVEASLRFFLRDQDGRLKRVEENGRPGLLASRGGSPFLRIDIECTPDPDNQRVDETGADLHIALRPESGERGPSPVSMEGPAGVHVAFEFDEDSMGDLDFMFANILRIVMACLKVRKSKQSSDMVQFVDAAASALLHEPELSRYATHTGISLHNRGMVIEPWIGAGRLRRATDNPRELANITVLKDDGLNIDILEGVRALLDEDVKEDPPRSVGGEDLVTDDMDEEWSTAPSTFHPENGDENAKRLYDHVIAQSAEGDMDVLRAFFHNEDSVWKKTRLQLRTIAKRRDSAPPWLTDWCDWLHGFLIHHYCEGLWEQCRYDSVLERLHLVKFREGGA